MKTLRLLLSTARLAAPSGFAASTRIIEADFCVYGGTSGGVVAAVQAA
jgi:hypothetical protein